MTSPISEAARLMGQARTPAKAAAARRNGAKGGRPRKVAAPAPATNDALISWPVQPRPVIVVPKPKEQD